MILPDGFYDTLHALTAKDARRLRRDWGIGSSGAKLTTGCMGHELLFKHASSGSGAKISLAECEQLFVKFTSASEHAAKGINVAALQRELTERTARQHTQWAWEQQEKKVLKKANKR